MPKPKLNMNADKSNNPLTAWSAKHEKRKRAQAAEAANELKIQGVLEGIDFVHSRLPKEILEHRTNPEQSCGDLELAAKALAKNLRENPVTIPADIRKIDEKIYKLAALYKDAVERGNENAAYAAKTGLVRGIYDIRRGISIIQLELIEQFVDLNAKYLERWITAVEVAQRLDQTTQNLERLEADYKERREAHRANVLQTYASIEKDPALRDAWKSLSQSPASEREERSDAEQHIYIILLQQRLENLRLHAQATLVDAYKMLLQHLKNITDALSTIQLELPLVAVPIQADKRASAMDNMVQALVKKQELEKDERFLCYMETELKQLAEKARNIMEICKEISEEWKMGKREAGEKKLSSECRPQWLNQWLMQLVDKERKLEEMIKDFNEQSQRITKELRNFGTKECSDERLRWKEEPAANEEQERIRNLPPQTPIDELLDLEDMAENDA